MLLCAVLGSGVQITLTIFVTLGIKPQPNDCDILTQHMRQCWKYLKGVLF